MFVCNLKGDFSFIKIKSRRINSTKLMIFVPHPLKWKASPWLARIASILAWVVAKVILLVLPVKILAVNPPPRTQTLMFVSNHTVGFGIDSIILICAIYVKTGIYPRGLADRMHFKVPIWAHVLYMLGVFPAERCLVEEVMQEGVPVIVFPCGREGVMRKKNRQKYELLWKQRNGFAQLAVKHSYTIVPACTIGLGDILSILQDVRIDYVFWLFGDEKPTTSIPICFPVSFERIYVKIGKPIETQNCSSDFVRQQTKCSVEELMAGCIKYQSLDPDRHLGGRLYNYVFA